MFRSNSDKINHKDIKTLADSIGSTLASRNKIAPFAQNKGRQDCEMRNQNGYVYCINANTP